ncbi:hypothetical protein ACEVHA_028340 [Klebsiella pneumoniae]
MTKVPERLPNTAVNNKEIMRPWSHNLVLKNWRVLNARPSASAAPNNNG